jgi:23S rRNA (cytidine1920-2'-O)/16S rRNA (cytidine1409-2'-O)-methyltransferase
VYALDVGHDQLAPSVAADPRVINREGVHINNVEVADFDPQPSLIVVDVSFISLTKVLAKIKELTPKGGQVILLVKPQFEVGRAAIGKGIVKDAHLHQEATDGVKNLALALGFAVDGPIPSPILGGDGNKEFLLHLTRRK